MKSKLVDDGIALMDSFLFHPLSSALKKRTGLFFSLKSRFAGLHVLGTEPREMEALQQKFLDARASFNEDGERLEEDVESGAKSADPEANKDEDHEPDNAPENVSSIAARSSVTFTGHVFTIESETNKVWTRVLWFPVLRGVASSSSILLLPFSDFRCFCLSCAPLANEKQNVVS